MKKTVLITLAAVFAAGTAIAPIFAAEKTVSRPEPKKEAKAEKTGAKKTDIRYTCPMHPDVISDKPGKCPKCGMFLEKVTVPAPKAAKANKEKNGKTDGDAMSCPQGRETATQTHEACDMQNAGTQTCETKTDDCCAKHEDTRECDTHKADAREDAAPSHQGHAGHAH